MIDSWAPTILPVLWSISWQAAIFAVLIWGISRAASKAPARLRYALWVLVIAKFFAPPFAQLPSQLAFWHSDAVPHQTSMSVAESTSIPDSRLSEAPAVSAPSPMTESPAENAWRMPDLSTLILVAWLAGVVGMCGLLLFRHWGQEWLLRDARPAGGDVIAAAENAARTIAVRRVPDVVFSPAVPIPALVGLLRPRIVLPACMDRRCSARELEAILLHEVAHLHRRDTLVLWIQQLAQALFFFHPAVWLAGREMRVEREFACDELVLASSAISPRDYAAGYMAALKMANGMPAPATCVAMAEPLEIETRRITMIMRKASPRLSRHWMAVLGALAVLGIPTFGGIATAASKTPTMDTIRAAWDKQNTGNIAVRYVQVGPYNADGPGGTYSTSDDDKMPLAAAGSRGKGHMEYTYIRTPEALYLNSHAWDREESAERIGVTRLGEGRKVSVSRGEGLKKVNGRIIRSHAGEVTKTILPASETERQWGMGWMETVLFRTYRRDDDPDTQFLYGWLKYAKIAEGTEKVDGHECLRLEVLDLPATGPDIMQNLRVWVDPEIGFCPRRIRMDGMAAGAVRGERGPFDIVTNFTDYVEVSKGIWFPGKTVMVKNHPCASMVNRTTEMTLEQLYKDRSFAKKDVMIRFQPGDTVCKIVTGERPLDTYWEEYIVGADGSLSPTE